MQLSDIIQLVLGRESGWRITSVTDNANFAVRDFGFRSRTLGLSSPSGVRYALDLRQVGVGIGIPEFNGADQAQGLLRTKLNKILTGPHETDVDASDLNGFYGSLSLGASTEGSENLTIFWFGDFATLGSIMTSTLPPISVAYQIGLATAVAIVPTGSGGAFLTKGIAHLHF